MPTRMTLARASFTALALITAACSDTGTPVSPVMATSGRLASTTTAPWVVTKTAIPFWNKRTDFDWSIAKTVSPASLTLALNASGSFTYTVTATRTEATSTSSYGMTGQICVANNSGASTSGMVIEDRIWQLEPLSLEPLVNIVIDVSAKPELANGESYCYPYAIDMAAGFVPDPAATYKNKAYVNSVDASGKLVRVGEYAVDVVFPTSPTVEENASDANASVTDNVACPSGFTCSPAGANWTFGTTGSQQFAVTVTNVSAACAETYEVVNSATLTEENSGSVRGPATATGTVTTPSCQQFAGETAVGAGIRYPDTSNWFMYSPYTTTKIDLIAGQHYDAGDIYMSRNATSTIIRIVLQNGFTWDEVAENLKINPYPKAPTTYVQPGAFAYKFTVSGNTVTVTIPGTSAKFYGIHGDVLRPLP